MTKSVIASRYHFTSKAQQEGMFATGYKNCFLRILLASDDECDAPFSLVVKISEAQDRKPVATLCIAEPIRSQEEGILRGFELGRHWIDKTSVLLYSVEPVGRKTMAHTRQILTELQSLIVRSAHTMDRSKHLIDRSHKQSVGLNECYVPTSPITLAR